MARIRTIKPEFWTSEQVMECSRDARLLFIGLWNFVDDKGRHSYNPKQIKALVFPADNDVRVEKWLGELVDKDLLLAYKVNGKRYLQITGWQKHQRIDRPQDPKCPEPLPKALETSQTFDDHSTIIRRSFDEPKNIDARESSIETEAYDNSTNVRRIIDDHSATDRKGEDRIKNTLPNGKAVPGPAPNGATRIKPETAAYNRCKKILGDKFGGKVAKELIAHSADDIDNVFQALKRIEEASDPRAYATAILHNYGHPACTDDWIT